MDMQLARTSLAERETSLEVSGRGNNPSMRARHSGEISPSPETFGGGNMAAHL